MMQITIDIPNGLVNILNRDPQWADRLLLKIRQETNYESYKALIDASDEDVLRVVKDAKLDMLMACLNVSPETNRDEDLIFMVKTIALTEVACYSNLESVVRQIHDGILQNSRTD